MPHFLVNSDSVRLLAGRQEQGSRDSCGRGSRLASSHTLPGSGSVGRQKPVVFSDTAAILAAFFIFWAAQSEEI